jgi:tRNA(Ile)-lysidine synthase TilS/MesJ
VNFHFLFWHNFVRINGIEQGDDSSMFSAHLYDTQDTIMAMLKRARELLNGPHSADPGRPLLGEDDWLIVAVSGGPVSLTLLHLLVDQDLHPAANLLVVHLDHGMLPVRPSLTSHIIASG